MTPKRIQRKRTKGWRMPEGAVYVGRPSRWGNVWTIGHRNPWGDPEFIDAYVAVELFRYGIDHPVGRQAVREGLAGRDLACWCPEECGEPVALYEVAYGDQYAACTKPAGHAGTHDPSAPLPFCHADVLLELANAQGVG